VCVEGGSSVPPSLWKKLSVFSYLSTMHILQVSDSIQSIVVIPRTYPISVTIELTDESKNTTSSPSVSVSNSNGYMTISGVFALVKSRFYTINVFDGTNLIYRGKIFCTDQTIFDKYSVNEGEYVKEQSYDNEYIIL
jgi:hypothetical protein